MKRIKEGNPGISAVTSIAILTDKVVMSTDGIGHGLPIDAFAYIDESRQNEGRYGAICVVSVAASHEKQIQAELSSALAKIKLSEFKFNEMSDGRHKRAALSILEIILPYAEKIIEGSHYCEKCTKRITPTDAMKRVNQKTWEDEYRHPKCGGILQEINPYTPENDRTYAERNQSRSLERQKPNVRLEHQNYNDDD